MIISYMFLCDVSYMYHKQINQKIKEIQQKRKEERKQKKNKTYHLPPAVAVGGVCQALPVAALQALRPRDLLAADNSNNNY